MPRAKQLVKSRRERDERKPKSFFSLDSYHHASLQTLGLGTGLRSKALLCVVTFLSTGLSYKTLEWEALALGAQLGMLGRVFMETIHGTAEAGGGEARLL